MSDTDTLAVNTIRTLAIDGVEQANSGHPGAPMGLAPLAYVLFTRHLRHNPADPGWPDRDRFVLSAGHASMLLYATLHLTGYDLGLDDLRQFRQLDSRTPGHPENFMTPGVETTTGPLGQGLGNAVGFALAERLLAARYNRPGHDVVAHRTWVIASDGDLMEGLSHEASSLAAHLRLGNLVVCWDDNSVTLDGPLDWSFSEDVCKRYEAYNWRILSVDDGTDLDAIDRALGEAGESDGRPTFVRVKTTIGFGAPNKAGTSKAHGSPLGPEEAAAAKQAYGWEATEPFTVPEDAARAADQRERGAALQRDWEERFEAYRDAEPELAAELDRVLAGMLPDDWDTDLPRFATGESLATRAASGKAINALAAKLPELIGGSADLASSNSTTITDGGAVTAQDFHARNVNYGVREHAMASALNGLNLHGGLRGFGGTFLTFSDYLRPALRLAALMRNPVIYVFTHDSIGLGEDGPTHQPVEHLAALRAIPSLVVLRPADARETVGAWVEAISRQDGPTALVLSRQNLPVLEGSDADEVARGAYAVVDAEDPDIVLVATGSEVHLAVDAVPLLAADGITARVVSMPSWELFADQDEDYQIDLLGDDEFPVLSVEAGVSFGWERWADDHVAIDHFGASAPGPLLMEEFGFTAQAVADAARDLLDEWDEDEEDDQ